MKGYALFKTRRPGKYKHGIRAGSTAASLRLTVINNAYPFICLIKWLSAFPTGS